jgi:hypothetical protein
MNGDRKLVLVSTMIGTFGPCDVNKHRAVTPGTSANTIVYGAYRHRNPMPIHSAGLIEAVSVDIANSQADKKMVLSLQIHMLGRTWSTVATRLMTGLKPGSSCLSPLNRRRDGALCQMRPMVLVSTRPKRR